MASWPGLVAELGKLHATKQFPQAAQLLREALAQDRENLWLRHQLVDVLTLSGQWPEALAILSDLADAYAREGFHAKAIAVVKRMQRLCPDDTTLEAKLAAALAANARQESFRAALKKPEETRFGRLFATQDRDRATQVGDEAEGVVTPLPAAEEPEPRPESPRAEEPAEPPRTAPSAPAGLTRSPLFSDFSHEELRALMGKLELLSFQPGEIIVSEGEPGNSMFVLADGQVRVYARDASGRHRLLRLLDEGEFFGEISLVTGSPRTATVVAATPCELLELSQDRLREVGARHPQVPIVIREFCDRRLASPEEVAVRGVPPLRPRP